MNQSALLNQLRIDRDAAPASDSSRKRLIVIAVVVGVLLVGAVAAFALLRTPPPSVSVESAVQMSSGASAASSILDATGYVTARRVATVSSKITGKVREVMIEEGQYVKAGAVLATLEDTEAQAQFSLVQAQLESSRSQVCDEPTGDLDGKTADEILRLLQTLNSEQGKTVVMVTHDPRAAEYAKHTLHLDKGQLAEPAAA